MTLLPSYRRSFLLATLSVAALVLVTTSPVHAQFRISAPFDGLGAQTLVPNGDFENDLDGWGVFNSMITFAPTTENPLFDTTSVRATVTTTFSGPGAAIFRTVSGLTPGETYVLSAFINTSNLTPQAEAYVDLSDIFDDPQVGVPGGLPTTQFTYASFVANDTFVNVRFVVDAIVPNVVPTGSFAIADNIAVTPLASFIPVNSAASAAPEPTSLAILAIGGLSFLSARRRNQVIGHRF